MKNWSNSTAPMMNTKLKRGDIINIDLEPVKQSETGKIRPCAVISNNIQNQHSPVIIIAVLTEWNEKKERIPVCLTLDKSTKGLKKKSVIDCGQIRTVSKKRIKGNPIANLSTDQLIGLEKALKISLSLS